ncbi:MAG: hypothetical protein IT162_13145 [Bryobacterales bacterium]|nr:hypothetical protein [Bryobacterales bacterium]
MDKDVKSPGAGRCPRCGMRLVANLPEALAYRLEVTTRPDPPALGGATTHVIYRVRHPHTGAVVKAFDVIHERVFHTFVISFDLADFAHEHPEPRPDGSFLLPVQFRRAVPYRVVADFFPTGSTPQFLTATVFPRQSRLPEVPRLSATPAGPRRAANLALELTTEPAEPVAGLETLLFFRLTPPADLVEPYLGAWGHLLIASDDLLDLAHEHPVYVDGVPPPDLRAPWPGRIQFNHIFARARTYRLWVQVKRAGVVNTVSFDVTVKALG